MRLFTLSIILSCSFLYSFAQVNNKQRVHDITNADAVRIMKENRLRWPNMLQAIKSRKQKNILPLLSLKNPAALSAFIKSQPSPVTIANNNVASVSKKNAHVLSGNGCVDSSFEKLVGLNDNAVYIDAITHTKDDGILLCGIVFNSTQQDADWQIKGLVMKADQNGNILWMKLFANKNNDKIYQISFGQIKELQNGDILVTGELPIIDTTNSNSYYLVPVFRLNSMGNQVWTTNFKSNLTHAEGVASVDFYNITEGQDGGIVLTGDSYDNVSDSLFETIVKMDAAGNKLWDVSFGGINTGSYGTEGVNAYIENSTVVVAGISHGNIGNGMPCAITFITLDYTTGATLKKRFFITNYNGISTLFDKEFTSYTNHSTRLANGHYLFYGNLFSDFLQASSPIDHLAVVEFDEGQNLINNAYTLSSGLPTTYYADYMYFNDSGKGLFTLFHINNPTSYGANVYIGSIQGQQIIKERAIAYNNIGLGGTSGIDQRSLCFMDDGGYMSVQSYFINGLYAKSYIELRRMHDSDTSSVCLGTDTSFVSKLPYSIVEDPTYNNLDSPYTNYITTAQYPIVILDTLQSTTTNPCKQQSNCDTVKIHGQQVLCGTQGQVLFTAYKNTLCGSAVIWNIDTAAVDSISYLNDTSVAITFKNINWHGELNASLSTGACTLPIGDSLLLHIISVQDSVDLGADTTLCSGNTITLHAGVGFSSYLWQDGSVDSIYRVTKPGVYHVAVTDFCGNTYKDTISITLANYYFSIGRDTAICSNDSLTLTATGGFNNYQWSPLYNISINNTDSIAAVSPSIDTRYVVSAQKWQGCYVSDSIQISVLHPAPVLLGNDTSFCSGDSITISAGTGFLSYLWNTGSINDEIIVKTAGSYSVIATNSNQCKSYDTLQVLQVFPDPVLNISYDSLLCSGSAETLNAGNSYKSYVWQDGSIGQSITVSSVGNYWVNVMDANGCKGSDTMMVTRLLPLLSGFLPADTAICNYASLLLQPLQSYASYLWSTGDMSPSITVKSAGVYSLQVTDQYGCAGSDSITVSINQCLGGAYFASAFTPNNDGHNDTYAPILLGNVVKYHFSIFNRYGQLVFESSQPGAGWDGTLSGNLQDGGTYVWSCSYQFAGDTLKQQKGTVVLIR